MRKKEYNIIKSIFTVEYRYNGNVIRLIGKYNIVEVVMKENVTHFKLAYDSLLFYKSNLDLVGTFGQNPGA